MILSHDRRRRHQPGHLRRDDEPRRALEAAGRLRDHQQPVRHGHRARPPLGGHRPVAARPRASACRARAATAWTCSTCTTSSPSALRCAREERKPQLVEAVTYRFRGHSMADPEEYRTKEEVEEWRERDPIDAFAERLVERGRDLTRTRSRSSTSEAIETVDEAVAFADESPFPDLDSLYDDVYVLGEHVPRLVDRSTSARPRCTAARTSARPASSPHQLAEAGRRLRRTWATSRRAPTRDRATRRRCGRARTSPRRGGAGWCR